MGEGIRKDPCHIAPELQWRCSPRSSNVPSWLARNQVLLRRCLFRLSRELLDRYSHWQLSIRHISSCPCCSSVTWEDFHSLGQHFQPATDQSKLAYKSNRPAGRRSCIQVRKTSFWDPADTAKCGYWTRILPENDYHHRRQNSGIDQTELCRIPPLHTR